MRCPSETRCSEWAIKYLGLCICNTRDVLVYALGFISVICWSVAEIPQVVTNYKKKSAESLSFWFLLTWIVGDLFNLFGCLLEPATLSTQYYMALLYTITTVTLAAQVVYYEHIYPRFKSKKKHQEPKEVVEKTIETSHGVDVQDDNNITRKAVVRSSPIPFPACSSDHNDLYFMSARSLSVSRTPTLGSFPASKTPTGDGENNLCKEPLLENTRPTQSAPSNIKTTLCVVSLMTFFLGGCDYKVATSNKNYMISNVSTKGVVLQVRRKLLERTRTSAHKVVTAESRGFGSILGWGMTVIYLGGRFPQIRLNIKRGSAEGLNPLMFVFALLGNLTYMGSILVHSTDFLNIRPNLPWLVDALGCIVLDTFILLQFFYFYYRSRN
ncbi:uncharacterized protein LOC127256795 [Andrographis paniculata]|uniref:uncharacterized protein LOC127256795 n=1 Tax=Andrographis paniculata TaxID=175694 RepID=UPI0021E922EF|nr:uncharacterized protein LOC127256795 [Andrographis paniculata]XP_051138953.1 uncharacterized protein LOC127256795 [Andrographis paniculata]XP_051138954.1 uncharacterized protein LOC127256795 [Andrographis paniculata]